MGVEPCISFEPSMCAREMNSLGTLRLNLDGFDRRAFGQKKFRNEGREARCLVEGEMLMKKRGAAACACKDEHPGERGAG